MLMEPTQPIGANDTVSTLALIKLAKAGIRTSPSVSNAVWWSHRIEKSEIETMAESNRYQVLSF